MRSPPARQVKLHEVCTGSPCDFANSGDTSVVITAAFGAYFVGVVCDHQPWCTFAWIFGSDENLIAAYLAKLADAQAMGRVSGWRLGLRLPGRLASLGICLAYISAAQQSAQAARFSSR